MLLYVPLWYYHLAKNLQKCHGCGQRSADCYRVFFNNLIVRHGDRRIMGMSITVENRDFQYSYYHLKRDHIVWKTAFVQNAVITDECHFFTAFTREREIETEKETERETERAQTKRKEVWSWLSHKM